MFQPRFAAAIREGRKVQTIRKRARCKPGDTLSLREWEGKAYRPGSKQVEIARVVCDSVLGIVLTGSPRGLVANIAGAHFEGAELDEEARRDGFKDNEEMEGQRITWRTT
jgi:hypothetical protein